jgi:hypothetical protein
VSRGDHGLDANNKVAEFKLLSSTPRRVRKVDRIFQDPVDMEARHWRAMADQQELVRKIAISLPFHHSKWNPRRPACNINRRVLSQ